MRRSFLAALAALIGLSFAVGTTTPARANGPDWTLFNLNQGLSAAQRLMMLQRQYGPRYYGPPPVYYAPPPAYYGAPPAYYGHPAYGGTAYGPSTTIHVPGRRVLTGHDCDLHVNGRYIHWHTAGRCEDEVQQHLNDP